MTQSATVPPIARLGIIVYSKSFAFVTYTHSVVILHYHTMDDDDYIVIQGG